LQLLDTFCACSAVMCSYFSSPLFTLVTKLLYVSSAALKLAAASSGLPCVFSWSSLLQKVTWAAGDYIRAARRATHMRYLGALISLFAV
jgi:hypothetical protein